MLLRSMNPPDPVEARAILVKEVEVGQDMEKLEPGRGVGTMLANKKRSSGAKKARSKQPIRNLDQNPESSSSVSM